jgi:hypothetical protein
MLERWIDGRQAYDNDDTYDTHDIRYDIPHPFDGQTLNIGTALFPHLYHLTRVTTFTQPCTILHPTLTRTISILSFRPPFSRLRILSP